MSEDTAKRRSFEEIIDLVYDALSVEAISSIHTIAKNADLDRETCRRHLKYIEHIQSKQEGHWLEIQKVEGSSSFMYRLAKKGRKR